jgi:ZIP family zinc transporter
LRVIAHDFTDGLNTVNLMLINKSKKYPTVSFLVLDALAPVIGALSTLIFNISKYAGNIPRFFMGFYYTYVPVKFCQRLMLRSLHIKQFS